MSIYPEDKPYLLLDIDRCKRNIERIATKAKNSNCKLRPHFKTHQSIEIGRWFREKGVRGITVSSPSMANYFIRDGWNDITIAFPFYPAQLESLQTIEKSASLRLFINDVEHLKLVRNSLKYPFKFYIEIDSGYGRSGIYFKNKNEIRELIDTAEHLDKVDFHGFYIHNGATYACNNRQEIIDGITPSLKVLHELKKEYPGSKISLGDTPSASVLDSFSNFDECTAGNFVFYDWMQVQIGSCTLDDISLYMMLPVAQIKKESAIVKGGAVHCSKDYLLQHGRKNYGQLIQFAKDRSISAMDGYLSSLSQEHGILVDMKKTIGDYVCVAPIHSCLTANLHNFYYTVDERKIEKRILS